MSVRGVFHWIMRRGLHQDYVNQLCQMTVGWRLSIADLPLLVDAAVGNITIDVLAGTSSWSTAEGADLTILAEITGWLHDAVERDAVPTGGIMAFTLCLDFHITQETDGHKQSRRVELGCIGELVTEGKTFTGSSHKAELWKRERPDTIWQVHDV